MRVIPILVVACLLLVVSTASAFQNEPDGFRGIPWGKEVRFLSGMRLMRELSNGVVVYKNIDDDMAISGLTASEIMYYFYKDRFYRVGITFEGTIQGVELRRLCVDKYDVWNNSFGNRNLIWKGNASTITLDWGDTSTLDISSTKISNDITKIKQKIDMDKINQGF